MGAMQQIDNFFAKHGGWFLAAPVIGAAVTFGGGLLLDGPAALALKAAISEGLGIDSVAAAGLINAGPIGAGLAVMAVGGLTKMANDACMEVSRWVKGADASTPEVPEASVSMELVKEQPVGRDYSTYRGADLAHERRPDRASVERQNNGWEQGLDLE
jgi:hypothetical protein